MIEMEVEANFAKIANYIKNLFPTNKTDFKS